MPPQVSEGKNFIFEDDWSIRKLVEHLEINKITEFRVNERWEQNQILVLEIFILISYYRRI